jgi:cytochrome P450
MMEMRILLPTILQRFKILPEFQSAITPEPLITLRPKGGLMVRIEKR